MRSNRLLTIPLIALFLACAGCRKQKASEADTDAATPVHIAKAATESIQQIVTADAILYPISQSAVTAKISAPVRRYLVNRGEHVRLGQLLAELEDRDLVAAVNENKALVEQSEAQFLTTTKGTLPEDTIKAKTDVETARQGLDAAQKLYRNRVALVREGALAQKLADDAQVAMVQAQSQLDVAKSHSASLQNVNRAASVSNAQSQVDAAKARLAGARAQAIYAEVRSPIDGIVAERALNAGEMASSGTALITIVNVSDLVARANVPVREASALRLGDSAAITGPDGELAGKVSVVSPAVDPASTTVEVWIRARNPGEKFRPGVTVRVSIQARTIANALVIPATALLASDEGENKVMVVGPDSVAHEQKVEIGLRQGDRVQVTEGLKPGDRVVTEGGFGLADKAKVEVTHE